MVFHVLVLLLLPSDKAKRPSLRFPVLVSKSQRDAVVKYAELHNYRHTIQHIAIAEFLSLCIQLLGQAEKGEKQSA